MKGLAWLALLSACSREPPPAEPKPEPPQRVRVLQGDAKLVRGSEPFALAEGAALTLAVDDGVRIELRGPGRFQLGPDQLLASDGLLSVDVAAQAVRAGQHAFSLATPAGLVEVPFAARLVLHGQELALISGEALADGSLPVGANTRVCFGAVGPHALPVPGFATVEAALAALPTSRGCAREQPPELAKLDQELAHQLELFTRNQAEQDALLASARAQPASGLVQELAARGQRTLAARTRVLALRAQLGAAQLGGAKDPARARLLTRAGELENAAR